MTWKNEQVSEKETTRILELARECLDVSGDYVEMGCYRGDTSLLLAEILQGYNRDVAVEKLVKKLWIYDSFEGLPGKSANDESVLGTNFKSGKLLVTKREVKERFLKAGLTVPVIKKAWFKDLTTDDLPSEIAFAFLDGDFYESIRDSLELVVPKMNDKGVIVVHDYTNPALPGVKRAVDELINIDNVKFRMVLL